MEKLCLAKDNPEVAIIYNFYPLFIIVYVVVIILCYPTCLVAYGFYTHKIRIETR